MFSVQVAPVKILTVVGNRPQFIKAAAVSGLLRERARGGAGAHRPALRRRALARVLRRAGSRRSPTVELGIGGGTNTSQTARMLAALEPLLAEMKPDAALVYGDTNSTLAGGAGRGAGAHPGRARRGGDALASTGRCPRSSTAC